MTVLSASVGPRSFLVADAPFAAHRGFGEKRSALEATACIAERVANLPRTGSCNDQRRGLVQGSPLVTWLNAIASTIMARSVSIAVSRFYCISALRQLAVRYEIEAFWLRPRARAHIPS